MIGNVAVVSGSDVGYLDGTATSAAFSANSGIVVGTDGMIYVADTNNNAIRKIDPAGKCFFGNMYCILVHIFV